MASHERSAAAPAAQPDAATPTESPERTLRVARYLRTDFLRSLAHALRSPLVVAQGALGELAASADEGTEPFARMARRNLKRIARLADQLEWVAELEAGGLQPVREPVDLAELAQLALASSDGKGPRVEHELEPGTCIVLGDRVLLQRVLGCLLENALRYASERVHLRVVARQDTAQVVLQDDGPGVEPARLPLLLDRYRSARERGAQGDLALSLSLAHDYVRLLGGRLVLDAPAGGGARWLLELPRAELVATTT